jgi:hypothetical protein
MFHEDFPEDDLKVSQSVVPVEHLVTILQNLGPNENYISVSALLP